MERTGFENLRVYGLAEQIADYTWEVVVNWAPLAQDTMGRQLIRSAGSIGANIAEGTGRATYADNKRFARMARGSLFEFKHWFKKAHRARLLQDVDIVSFQRLIEELIPKLSAYINSIGKKSTVVNNGRLATNK